MRNLHFLFLLLSSICHAQFSICPDSAQVNINVTGSNSYYWNFGGEVNPSIIYLTDKVHFIKFRSVDSTGCYHDTTIRLESEFCYELFIPNSFTPNGDGTNDIFEGKCLNCEIDRYWIFNRWGELIYESANGWDGFYFGKIVQIDVYLYRIEYFVGVVKKSVTGRITVVE